MKMADNILVLGKIMNETDAEKIIAYMLAEQKKFIAESGEAARIAYSESSNCLLPQLLAGAGIHTCVFSADCDEIPEDYCYISAGLHRVLSYKLKENESLDILNGMYEKIAEQFPDFPVFTAASLSGCDFTEKENDTEIFISEKNIKLSLIKKCEDGSGDTNLRVFERSDENAPNETHAFITSESLDCGFWLDIRKNEVKTYRIGGETVREVNFIEGMIPFDTMID